MTLAAALAAGAAQTQTQAQAQALAKLNVVAFAGASNLAIWAGQQQGIFARHGLEVALELTPNSRAMASDLYSGKYDLALTSVDNIVAYNEGQGEARLPGPSDFTAFFGVDDGMLSVMAAADVPDLAALRGKVVSVDAMTTGFAFVLREVLGQAGIADQVEWVAVGGGAQRLAALLEGKQAATLLNTPLDLAAEARGFRRLARGRDAVGAYQGIVAAARRGTLAAKRDQLIGFTRGFRESLVWLDANRAEAAGILTARANMPPPVAARAATALLDPERGIFRDLRIDEAGLRTVLRLRSKYAQPQKELTDIARYIDPSIRAATFG
ncbi:ABC transporter substrate-binding protein [Roseomonas frigidaquae]|uniref:ABC transporter substrate-binding protein n=1 Tax=Falsiroseomonas frigidaquae TaxID=487318 RepID=A0ABX1EX54_9PROT|nr:ABC transporter substrate-binding protein [Falsiroseomonas frigidaquae]NKE44672.1 ABC transporter substrate-binding protein [Falsiroseomonas frigidaquae]